jgi:hypothetical protein
LAELFSLRACLEIANQAKREQIIPARTRLYVGDIIAISRLAGKGTAKGADMHLLVRDENEHFRVAGVVEVKSYACSESRMRKQIASHLSRILSGLVICGTECQPSRISIGTGQRRPAIRVMVTPSTWKLPRTFRFEDKGEESFLHVDELRSPLPHDDVKRVADHEWRVVLRWSQEALAATAYEMTFWYMAKVGEVIYANGVPEYWSGMTPSQAGQNAAKMMLYYAILRARTRYESQRAIALYNAYGFGYALGANFMDINGRREVLFFEDLREILAKGRTKHGCRIG